MHLVDMFELWNLVEDDLLSETIPYRLRDTGQGKLGKDICGLNLTRLQDSTECNPLQKRRARCTQFSIVHSRALAIGEPYWYLLGRALRHIFTGSGAQ